ncbi:Nucleoside-diphosphate-sugar epimerase [Chitinophaga sp. CF118]|uniref:SDR family oxidoreductase n=1 Tax=Chitinophaga sp. CF118 TaxID=1884367 RepID=UPI0008E7B299|nr:SDR family oxidoreductase [Chitinophaga sp. CF118]SFD48177.1 Nucleoside-diphosphate-sugar epimerase [Chitinophaga sp. CF118]
METISILGCGWLGLPLAEHLFREGLSVKGSVSHPQKVELLRQKGILPYEIQITDTEITGDDIPGFLASDILIINFPPARREDIVTYHTAQMTLLIDAIKKSSVRYVLFVSSTSVYPELNREITEADQFEPSKGSGKALIAVEQMLQSQTGFQTTILRFAGLIGYDRQPGRFLAGKTNVENGESPINVIHQDDCIALITEIIRQGAWNEVFNACSDIHPTRKEFYTLAAEKIGLVLPDFAPSGSNQFKIINSDKIKHRLGYSFKYPNPLETL